MKRLMVTAMLLGGCVDVAPPLCTTGALNVPEVISGPSVIHIRIPAWHVTVEEISAKVRCSNGQTAICAQQHDLNQRTIESCSWAKCTGDWHIISVDSWYLIDERFITDVSIETSAAMLDIGVVSATLCHDTTT